MCLRIYLLLAALFSGAVLLPAADLDGLTAVAVSGSDGVPLPGPALHASGPMVVEAPVEPLPQLAAADTPPAALAIPAADSPPTGNPLEGAPEPAPSPSQTPAAPETKAPGAAGAPPLTASPSQNVTINLISLMVKRGLITREDAEGLIQQAEQEAATARNEPASAQASSESSMAAAPSPPGGGDSDDVAVNYVPDVVKKQIRDDVTADVRKQARDEHWGKDDPLPDWVHRFHVTGDIRVRTQADDFPTGNDNTGAFTAFNTINTGAPFDTSTISNPRFPPEYNVDQDRFRIRLRARIGAGIDLGDNFTAGLRIGTGQDNSPTTQNQTLGLANSGQGGDFSKYAVWLDRAFIRYDLGGSQENFSVSIGRFDNPFLSSSMIWASEIGFDGFALQGNYEPAKGVKVFGTGGAFPVFNTDFNFASNQPAKFESDDKWLYAAQAGIAWQINKDFTATGAAAIYYFDNVAGRLSSPFTPLSAADQGDTDDTRPSFAQNGNTYRELRDIAPTAANGFGTIDQFQYYGLATDFHDVALTGKIDFGRFDPFHLQLLGEFVDNVAFDRSAINRVAVNNGGAGGFIGGAQGYNVRLTVGQPVLQKLWDWNIDLTYRYVESDCTIDGFTDSDFGGPLVGTNLKGYIIGGYLALSPRVTASLRFLSADAIAGPPYHDDVLQFDINAKF